MADTDQNKMDDVLKRMLSTPPKPHKPSKDDEEESHSESERRDRQR